MSHQFAPIVDTSYGDVIGFRKRNPHGGEYFSYYDIPYGKVENRFVSFLASPDPYTLPSPPHPSPPKEYSRDDCCYIHIHTPTVEEEADLPVFVFVPSEPHMNTIPPSTYYGPEYLVAEDVVVVVIGYRTGLLVDLTFDDESVGAFGYGSAEDIIEALTFIKFEIVSFGGSPFNVTVCGQGYGAAYLRYVLLMESQNTICEDFKLFHKVIFQSSLAHQLPTVNELQISGRKVASVLGFNDNELSDAQLCENLRSVPLQNLLGYESHFYKGDDILIRIICSDVCDQLFEYSNLNWKYPIIIGFNSGEGIFEKVFSPEINFHNFNYERLLEGLHHYWNDKVAQSVENVLKSEDFAIFNNFALFNLLSDLEFNIGILWLTKILTYMMSPCPVYLYKFDVDGNRNDVKRQHQINLPGACHGDELGYIFKLPLSPPIVDDSLEDLTVTRMIKYWTNFAKYHNPNPPHVDRRFFNVRWRNLLVFDTDVERRYEMSSFVLPNCLTIGPILQYGIIPEEIRMYFWNSCLPICIFKVDNLLKAFRYLQNVGYQRRNEIQFLDDLNSILHLF